MGVQGSSWKVSCLDVLYALTGELLTQVQTHGKNLDEVYKEVDSALKGAFVWRLVQGESDVSKLPIADIQGPLKVVKLRRRGLHKFGIHSVLRQMGKMEGSGNVYHLVSKLDDDADALHLENLADFYSRVFGNTCESEGYIVQARLLKLHEMITSHHGSLSLDHLLSNLRAVGRDSAISMLIDLHNDGSIELSRRRFRPLALELGLPLR